ncbi:hypothetical protein BX070DRAFT_232681 [Coemansia spiralis]|nr:hypothetical protein BX070DRAFT_232681 [Coemansia spiralis]
MYGLLIALLCTLLSCVLGCGPAVHNEVAERARRWFFDKQGSEQDEKIAQYRDILDRHPESLQAGVVFPDWGYGCMSMDEEAEAAHWTPFLEYGLDHFLATYKRPYSQRAEQLVAFLFGIASHQVADELWHSLSGLQDGFMLALSNSTFNGEFGRAHDVLDVGGDFAMAHMDSLSYILDKWTVPVDDVMAIYKEMGVDVSRWRMNICITRQFYAMEAVKRFGRGLFPSYASRAPMLTERLDDYYMGGLFSMATSTSDCWFSLVDWFNDGNFTRKCLVSDNHKKANKGSNGRKQHQAMPSNEVLHRHSFYEMLMQAMPEVREQLEVNATVSTHEHDGFLYLSTNRIAPESERRKPESSNVRPHVGNNPKQHAFIAKAQHGNKDLHVENCASLETLFPKIKQLYTTSEYSGFGTAIVTGDFSGSDKPSIAISAPYFKGRWELLRPGSNSTSTSKTYIAGAVFVVDAWDLQYTLSYQNIIDAEPFVLLPSEAMVKQKTANESNRDDKSHSSLPRYPLFGSSMAVIDFNADGIDDLAVGSSRYGQDPTGSFLGRVDIYLGHAGAGLSSVPDFTLTAEQLAVYMDSPWSGQRIGGFLFGEDVNNDGFVDLVIGAPYNSDVPYEVHAGKLFGYISHPSRRSDKSGLMGRPDFSLVSPQRQSFEWFGFAAKSVHVDVLNTTLLLVGAPGHKSREPSGDKHSLSGMIYAFSVVNGTESETIRPPAFKGLEFALQKDNTQLGSQIHVWQNAYVGSTLNEQTGKTSTPAPLLVLFGSPSEHSSGMDDGRWAVSGKASGPPSEPIPERGWQAGEVRILDPRQWSNDTHKNNAPSDHTIAGLISTLRGSQSPGHFGRALTSSESELWIGEPLSEMEDGRVYRWAPENSNKSPTCFFMPNALGRARLGQVISSARWGYSHTLAVAMPHDSQFSRLSGSVLLLETAT